MVLAGEWEHRPSDGWSGEERSSELVSGGGTGGLWSKSPSSQRLEKECPCVPVKQHSGTVIIRNVQQEGPWRCSTSTRHGLCEPLEHAPHDGVPWSPRQSVWHPLYLQFMVWGFGWNVPESSVDFSYSCFKTLSIFALLDSNANMFTHFFFSSL